MRILLQVAKLQRQVQEEAERRAAEARRRQQEEEERRRREEAEKKAAEEARKAAEVRRCVRSSRMHSPGCLVHARLLACCAKVCQVRNTAALLYACLQEAEQRKKEAEAQKAAAAAQASAAAAAAAKRASTAPSQLAAGGASANGTGAVVTAEKVGLLYCCQDWCFEDGWAQGSGWGEGGMRQGMQHRTAGY